MDLIRCEWPLNDTGQIEYHDNEWGVPLRDDEKLFEFLILDAFQAGLSWKTILNKRENFRQAFDGFNPLLIAAYNQEKVASLLQDAGIVRNKLKVNAAILNAQAYLRIKDRGLTFAEYIWQFVENKPILNAWTKTSQIPATSPESDKMSKALVKEGFKFVGSTICYAFMQAAGLVNDHLVSCYRYQEIISKY